MTNVLRAKYISGAITILDDMIFRDVYLTPGKDRLSIRHKKNDILILSNSTDTHSSVTIPNIDKQNTDLSHISGIIAYDNNNGLRPLSFQELSTKLAMPNKINIPYIATPILFLDINTVTDTYNVSSIYTEKTTVSLHNMAIKKDTSYVVSITLVNHMTHNYPIKTYVDNKQCVGYLITKDSTLYMKYTYIINSVDNIHVQESIHYNTYNNFIEDIYNLTDYKIPNILENIIEYHIENGIITFIARNILASSSMKVSIDVVSTE